MKAILRPFILSVIILMFATTSFAQDRVSNPVAPSTLDDVESGINTSIDLSMLVNNGVVTGSFQGDVTARLYYFNGSAGDVVTISMIQQSNDLDPYIVLLGSLGEVIAVDDNSGEVNLSAQIRNVMLPVSGSYFVMVTTPQSLSGDVAITTVSDSELGYLVSLSGATTPTDVINFDPDTYAVYTGNIATDDIVNGYSSAQEPVFYFLYDGIGGDSVNLNLTSGDFDTALHVFGNGGDRLFVNNDANGTNSAVENFNIPETSQYLIFATDARFEEALLADGSYRGGNFTLSISRPGASV